MDSRHVDMQHTHCKSLQSACPHLPRKHLQAPALLCSVWLLACMHRFDQPCYSLSQPFCNQHFRPHDLRCTDDHPHVALSCYHASSTAWFMQSLIVQKALHALGEQRTLGLPGQHQAEACDAEQDPDTPVAAAAAAAEEVVKSSPALKKPVSMCL